MCRSAHGLIPASFAVMILGKGRGRPVGVQGVSCLDLAGRCAVERGCVVLVYGEAGVADDRAGD